MLVCDPNTLTELDKLIGALANQPLHQPLLREHAASCYASRDNRGNNGSYEGAYSLPLSLENKKNRVCSWQRLGLSLVFLGQLLATAITAIPLYNMLKKLFAPETQAWAPLLLLSIPFLLSSLDSFQSLFSAIHIINQLEQKDISEQVYNHSINGFAIGIRPLAHNKKPSELVSALRILGSFFIPVCYAFTAADISLVASQLSWVSALVFSCSLISLLLESQINHSFFLLSRFISARVNGQAVTPNTLQQYWIRWGCWLNMRRRFLNGIHSLSILTVSFGIPHYLIDSYDAFPNHLYWGGLMGLSAAACLAQLDKNHQFVQSQNRQLPLKKACTEKIRCFLFDRPELALLWQFATTLKPIYIVIFGFLSAALLALPLCDQFMFSPSLVDYHADACVFALGCLLFFFLAHATIARCNPTISQQISYSSWESLSLACSASALLGLLSEYRDLSGTRSALKVSSFVAIYLFSSLVVTLRDTALNHLQISNLFWRDPITTKKNRIPACSDSILYRHSTGWEKRLPAQPLGN